MSQQVTSELMKALGRETRVIIEDTVRPLALQIGNLKAETVDLRRELSELRRQSYPSKKQQRTARAKG